MAAFRDPDNPTKLVKGANRGLIPVRWRPTRNAPQRTGYLSDVELLVAYTAYEQRCWLEGTTADAPELHFAAQVDATRETTDAGDRSDIGGIGTVRKVLTLRQWVGTCSDDATRRSYTVGPFFDHTVGAKRPRDDAARRDHVSLVSRSELDPIATVPMDQVTRWDVQAVTEQWFACPECVERAVEAGRTPGDELAWAQLVPRVGREPWDGGRCRAHHTKWKRNTYDKRIDKLRSQFNTTGRQKAADAGFAAVRFPADAADLSEDVIFKGSVHAHTSAAYEAEAEELRYGLLPDQVRRLHAASPPLYATCIYVWAFLFSRGGQEAAGLRIGDFVPHDSRTVIDAVIAGNGGGMVNLFNFRKRAVNGRRYNAQKGKTDRARRQCPMPGYVIDLLVAYILKFRSTPHPDCLGCRAGHRHWPTNQQTTNPHEYTEGGTECPMAADAPLFVDADGSWFDPDAYTANVWPGICEAAGLTKATLGWTPLPKHFRSTGTTLAMTSPNPNIELVVRLGGWSDAKMIIEHYYRVSPAAMIVAVEGIADFHFGTKDGTDQDDVAVLQAELAQARAHLAAAEKQLRALGAGLMDIRPVNLAALQPAASTVGDDATLVTAVRAVVLDGGGGMSHLFEHFELAKSGKSYRRMRRRLADLNIPEPPRFWSTTGDARRQEKFGSYIEQLTTALNTAETAPRAHLRAG